MVKRKFGAGIKGLALYQSLLGFKWVLMELSAIMKNFPSIFMLNCSGGEQRL
jgi:hypothetical protein